VSPILAFLNPNAADVVARNAGVASLAVVAEAGGIVGMMGTPGHIECASVATCSRISGVGGDSGLMMGLASTSSVIQCPTLPAHTRLYMTLYRGAWASNCRLPVDAKPIISPESRPRRRFSSKWRHWHIRCGPVYHHAHDGHRLSDDRQTRNAGIPSYDISGIWIEEGENRAHGRDERVSVRAFDESVEFTYRLMKSMEIRANFRYLTAQDVSAVFRKVGQWIYLRARRQTPSLRDARCRRDEPRAQLLYERLGFAVDALRSSKLENQRGRVADQYRMSRPPSERLSTAKSEEFPGG